MTATLTSGDTILFRLLEKYDAEALHQYLKELNPISKSRFAPHLYDIESIRRFYENPTHRGFIAELQTDTTIVAYAILKSGFLFRDAERLQNHGLILHSALDGTYAPSVSDNWQAMGIGTAMLGFVKLHAMQLGIERLILWGGVQQTNIPAIHYYKRNGFAIVGAFEYFGMNYDMVKSLSSILHPVEEGKGEEESESTPSFE